MQETAVNRIVALLLAQQQGQLTPAEKAELETWSNLSTSNRSFVERCGNITHLASSVEQLDTIDDAAAFQRFSKKNAIDTIPVLPFRKTAYHWVAAAILLGVVGTGVFYWLNVGHQKAETESIARVNKGEHIPPGSNQATLTLSDGRTLFLHDSADGLVAQEGGARVKKRGHELVYDPAQRSTRPNNKEILLYHTVTTPRGGRYELTLPDQTKVWLNAEASIRYPTSFTGPERKVVMTGEAYFEVTKKANQPFIVTANKIQVKVLGTQFNIRAYAENEGIQTTLLEGSVAVSTGHNNPASTAILQPGEQAVLFASFASPNPKIQAVDVESVIAWKTGYFDFKATPLAAIMQDLKRWYAAIETIEIKEPVHDRLTATIPRNVPLSTMLTILEATGKVHFEVKDKSIIVTR